MASPLSLPKNPQIFTHHWTAMLPAFPALKIVRTTPADFDVRLSIVSSAQNRAFLDSKDTIWDVVTVANWKARQTARYVDSKTKLDCVDALVTLDDRVVGLSNITTTKPELLNVGIMLNEEVRGKGVGKATMRAMIQVAVGAGVGKVGVGTMKANAAMRGIMKSLGAKEREEDVFIEGRGVVAEIIYVIEPEEWEDVGLHVEFGNEA